MYQDVLSFETLPDDILFMIINLTVVNCQNLFNMRLLCKTLNRLIIRFLDSLDCKVSLSFLLMFERLKVTEISITNKRSKGSLLRILNRSLLINFITHHSIRNFASVLEHHSDIIDKPLFIKTNDINVFIDKEKKIMELNDPAPYLFWSSNDGMQKRGMSENGCLFRTIIKRIGNDITNITWRIGENKIPSYRWSKMFPKLTAMILSFSFISNHNELALNIYFAIHHSDVKEWILETKDEFTLIQRLMDVFIINDGIKGMTIKRKITIYMTKEWKVHYQSMKFSNINILTDENEMLMSNKTNILFIEY
jgi:hypothetical protein